MKAPQQWGHQARIDNLQKKVLCLSKLFLFTHCTVTPFLSAILCFILSFIHCVELTENSEKIFMSF